MPFALLLSPPSSECEALRPGYWVAIVAKIFIHHGRTLHEMGLNSTETYKFGNLGLIVWTCVSTTEVKFSVVQKISKFTRAFLQY